MTQSSYRIGRSSWTPAAVAASADASAVKTNTGQNKTSDEPKLESTLSKIFRMWDKLKSGGGTRVSSGLKPWALGQKEAFNGRPERVGNKFRET